VNHVDCIFRSIHNQAVASRGGFYPRQSIAYLKFHIGRVVDTTAIGDADEARRDGDRALSSVNVRHVDREAELDRLMVGVLIVFCLRYSWVDHRSERRQAYERGNAVDVLVVLFILISGISAPIPHRSSADRRSRGHASGLLYLL
jgi:hypothetical protein